MGHEGLMYTLCKSPIDLVDASLAKIKKRFHQAPTSKKNIHAYSYNNRQYNTREC